MEQLYRLFFLKNRLILDVNSLLLQRIQNKKTMKKVILLALMCFSTMLLAAQDSTAFHAYLYNEDYKVYLDINFYKNDVVVPGQEIFGKMPGYFGALRDSRKWLITSAVVENGNTAKLAITNDYGSEDLEATLVRRKDGTYPVSYTHLTLPTKA